MDRYTCTSSPLNHQYLNHGPRQWCRCRPLPKSGVGSALINPSQAAVKSLLQGLFTWSQPNNVRIHSKHFKYRVLGGLIPTLIAALWAVATFTEMVLNPFKSVISRADPMSAQIYSTKYSAYSHYLQSGSSVYFGVSS